MKCIIESIVLDTFEGYFLGVEVEGSAVSTAAANVVETPWHLSTKYFAECLPQDRIEICAVSPEIDAAT